MAEKYKSVEDTFTASFGGKEVTEIIDEKCAYFDFINYVSPALMNLEGCVGNSKDEYCFKCPFLLEGSSEKK